MPKRRDLTPDQLAKIVQLYERNPNWSLVQRETGVPRQIAKRAYMAHKLSQPSKELSAARQSVAAQELRWHIDCVIKLAQSLVAVIRLPEFDDRRSANAILIDTLGRDIIGESEQPTYSQRTNQEIQRTRRQNQKLLASLQAHTIGKLDLRKTLDNWESAWDACRNTRDKLIKEAREILSNRLEKWPYVSHSIEKETKNKDVIKGISNGTAYCVWQGILIGELEDLIHKLDNLEDQEQEEKVDQIIERIHQEIASSVEVVPMSHGIGIEIKFGKTNPVLVPIFSRVENHEAIVDILISISDTLCRGGKNAKPLIDEFSKMRKVIEELEEKLDSIVLRPTILNSPKCDLCPA